MERTNTISQMIKNSPLSHTRSNNHLMIKRLLAFIAIIFIIGCTQNRPKIADGGVFKDIQGTVYPVRAGADSECTSIFSTLNKCIQYSKDSFNADMSEEEFFKKEEEASKKMEELKCREAMVRFGKECIDCKKAEAILERCIKANFKDIEGTEKSESLWEQYSDGTIACFNELDIVDLFCTPKKIDI